MNQATESVIDQARDDQPSETETESNLLVLGEVSEVTEGGFWGGQADAGDPFTRWF